jgi:hypothetical protein
MMVRMPGCPSALHSHVDIVVVRVRRSVRPAFGFRAIGHGPPEAQHPLLSESHQPSPAPGSPGKPYRQCPSALIACLAPRPHRICRVPFSPLDSVSRLILSGRVES